MEKTTAEKIQCVRDWIAEHGATEDVQKLLEGIERENTLYCDLIPPELFRHLVGSNVGPISLEDIPRLKELYPEEDVEGLVLRGWEFLTGVKPDRKEGQA